jgi:hypothetical protein
LVKYEDRGSVVTSGPRTSAESATTAASAGKILSSLGEIAK